MRNRLSPLAHCCAPYSAIGALFMFWVGMMIIKQPFLLVGLKDYDECKDTAFGTMWLFIFLFVTSVIYICYDSVTQSNGSSTRGRGGGSGEYVDEDDTRPILPPGMSNYRVNSEVELSHLDSQHELEEVREVI